MRKGGLQNYNIAVSARIIEKAGKQMLKIRIFLLVSITTCSIYAGEVTVTIMRGVDQARIQKVAVMQFQTKDYQGDDKSGDVGADLYAAELAKTGYYELVERRELDKLLKEQALGQTGIIDEKTAIKAGQISGAQGLLIGSATGKLGMFALTVKLVDTQTGKTAWIMSIQTTSAKDAGAVLAKALEDYYSMVKEKPLAKNLIVTENISHGIAGADNYNISVFLAAGGPTTLYSAGIISKFGSVGANFHFSTVGLATGLSVYVWRPNSLEITAGYYFPLSSQLCTGSELRLIASGYTRVNCDPNLAISAPWETWRDDYLYAGAGWRQWKHGLVFSVTGYGLYSVNFKKFSPWLGASVGYAFF